MNFVRLVYELICIATFLSVIERNRREERLGESNYSEGERGLGTGEGTILQDKGAKRRRCEIQRTAIERVGKFSQP